MKTVVTERGKPAIRSKFRKKFGIKVGDRLEWLDDGQIIKVIPLHHDPVRALRGCAAGEGLLDRLLAECREEARRGC
ncbi:MAG: AbrB/MazE/SpoVT family DNA-binding domain-containing protein [Thermaerobacter sp.]|jgi:bifunctional DNA-binding transcriptional regulator/antitoxin component of YhaV-PrlF toxin-antitoxin module|nr:AbrB/MazE/SpoVT family DNA-binding domain-containing protein [Thermaerobacter sp.]